MGDVVGFAIEFIRGLYYRGLSLDAEPDVSTRRFYLGRDIRVLPQRPGGYHSRFIAWFDRLNDLVHFPSRVEFTRPGERNARPLYLSVIEAKERLGITGDSTGEVLLKAFEELGYAVQASLAYTRASKTEVYSGEVYALERIMLELESKGSKDLGGVRDAVLRALDGLSPYVETPIVIFSGHKSYYIVLELPKPIRAGEYDIRDRLGVVVRRVSLGEVHRAFYELIVRRYLHNDNAITKYLDNQVAEPKRLLRIPGFKHEVGGQPAQLLDTDLHPIDLDPSVMDRAVLTKDALTDAWPLIYALDTPRTGRKAVMSDNPQRGTRWDCLPGWVRALIDYLGQTGELCHYGRLAVAAWMIKCGFSDGEVHEVFKHADDYNARVTQYHINDVRKYLEGGGKPMRCVSVVENCKGHNVPSIDCKSLPNPPTKPEAPTADPKPKEKPESKTETKSEIKPADAKPRQVSTPRVGIGLPDTVIEGVARELRESAAVVRELVNWVVGYLDSLPCCQAIHTEQVLDGLLASANEDIIFTLYTLGIDYKAVWTDPGYFSALWDAYITILKYLDQAGIVEVKDDGATIVVNRGGMCRCGDTEDQVEVARHA